MAENKFIEGNPSEYSVAKSGRMTIKVDGKTLGTFDDELKKKVADLVINQGVENIKATYWDKEKQIKEGDKVKKVTYHNLTAIEVLDTPIEVTEEKIETAQEPKEKPEQKAEPKYKYSFGDKEDHSIRMSALKNAMFQVELEQKAEPDKFDSLESIGQRRDVIYKELIDKIKGEEK